MTRKPSNPPPSAPPTTARDREMGRDAPQSGDLGNGRVTWAPPPGKPGISTRPVDEKPSTDEHAPDDDGRKTVRRGTSGDL